MGFWRKSGEKFIRKVNTIRKCLKSIGGMNKILTDIGSLLNMLLCAGLVKVYIAEAYG